MSTRCHATARWGGPWWSVEFTDLPEGFGGATQGRTQGEAESMAREAVALLLELDEDAFEMVVDFAESTEKR